jgi:hypothetical protein
LTWLEKDALARLFLETLAPYHVALNVGRGYDGWSSVHNAALRLREQADTRILYFGDFDPSGEDMMRSLRERLNDQGAYPQIVKVALNEDDIARYSLPPNRTKQDDSRAAAYIARFGDVSVELDALALPILRERIVETVEDALDMEALALVWEEEERGRVWLAEQVAAIKSAREG